MKQLCVYAAMWPIVLDTQKGIIFLHFPRNFFDSAKNVPIWGCIVCIKLSESFFVTLHSRWKVYILHLKTMIFISCFLIWNWFSQFIKLIVKSFFSRFLKRLWLQVWRQVKLHQELLFRHFTIVLSWFYYGYSLVLL